VIFINKEYVIMKNIFLENMHRFKTKNLNEQSIKPVLPADTTVTNSGTNINVGNKQKTYTYSVHIKDLGQCDVDSVDLNIAKNKFTITLWIQFGLGALVNKKLAAKAAELAESGVTVSRIEGDWKTADRQKFVIDLTKNEGIVSGIEQAKNGPSTIKLTDEITLKITS